MERVSIVIPVRDEAETIGLVLEDIRKATSEIEGYEFETIVVDDGSSDGGPAVARTHGAHVIPNSGRHGKGAALRVGFAASTGSIIVMMDGDYSHRADELAAFVDALGPGISLVIGSRIFGGSDEYTPVRAFGNIVLSYLFGILHGRYLSDALNGYKAFRRDIFTRFEYTSVSFEIEIELVANALRAGGRIVEIPSHERARAGGRSKSRVLRHGVRFLARIIYEWARPRRRQSLTHRQIAVGTVQRHSAARRESFGGSVKPEQPRFADAAGPRVSKRIDFGQYYSGLGGSPLLRWLDAGKVRLLCHVIELLPFQPVPRLLDIGCGTGSVLGRALAGRPALAVGVDIHPALLRQATQRSLRGVLASFDEVLPFREDTFDAVIMVDTLEHVTSRERVIAEVKRVLRPDGYLVVFTPPYDSPFWNLGEWVHWAMKRRMGSDHISPFTGESLRWLLARNFGFHEVRKTNFNLTMYGLGHRKLDGLGQNQGNRRQGLAT